MPSIRGRVASVRSQVDWRRTLALSVLAFVASALFIRTVPRFELPFASPVHQALHGVTMALWWEWLALIGAVAVAVAAFREQAVVRNLALVAAVSAGFGVHLGGLGITGEPTIWLRVQWSLVVPFAVTLVLGGAGYFVGSVAREMATGG